MRPWHHDWRAVLRRVVITALAVSIGCAGVGAFAPASAQVPGPILSSARDADITEVLAEGQALESKGRWADALTHYEEALHKFPSQTDLERRHTLSQVHCDLARRHADSSYVRLLKELGEQRALDSYGEILDKVQIHYVQAPDWQKLTWRGTANLDVALTRADFQKFQIPRDRQDQIDAFRHELRNSINNRMVTSQNEATDLVAYTARLAAHRLGVRPAVTVMEYASGAISALDNYSTYLSGAQLDDVYSQIEGNFVGLGVELKSDQNSLLIVNVIEGGPADLAGIVAGDRIVEVDGFSTSDVSTDKAADMLKGKDGSIVGVAVQGPDQQLRRLNVRRQRVDVPCVEDVQMVDRDHGIGYFRLTSFQKTTSRDVDAALWRLHRDGMRSLVVDVRGNPGGLLTASVEVADKFLSEGTIVSTLGRSDRENNEYQAHRVGTWKVPLVVLIDGDTASASEIFAGAIHDHRRGTILGVRSYGKGSVQGIFPLNEIRSGVRLTTAKFYSPSGRAISGNGVDPHHIVQQVAKPDLATGHLIPLDQDAVLSAAKDLARRLTVANR